MRGRYNLIGARLPLPVTMVWCGDREPVAFDRSAVVAAFGVGQAGFAEAALPGCLPSVARVRVPVAPVSPVRDAAPER